MPFLRFIPETTNIDFVRWRYVAFAVDGLLMLIAVISIVVQGFNLDIDFTGGSQIQFKAAHAIDLNVVRPEIAKAGYAHAIIQNVGGSGQCNTPPNSCILVRVQPQKNQSDQQVIDTVKKVLGPGYSEISHDSIGPKVSGELFDAGVKATILAIVLISLYVWFRFEWQYGLGALIATGHDVFVTAGLYSVAHLSFSINSVAALLLLAGYSINDTVVVFDRIRENRRKYKRMALPDLINLSTNHIATRTTLVSVATSLAIIPLLFFGGPALFDFSAAILFGILVGTFSSTYVAAALLLYLPPIGGGGTTKDVAADSRTAP